MISLLVLSSASINVAAAPRRESAKKVLSIDERNLSNLEQWMPIKFKRWQSQIPAKLFQTNLRWLTHFQGVNDGLRPMIIDGKKALVGGVCQPRWCVNDVEVVIEEDHIPGLVHLQTLDGDETLANIGHLSTAEVRCLTRLRIDARADCPE